MDRIDDGFLDSMRWPHVVRDTRSSLELRKIFERLIQDQEHQLYNHLKKYVSTHTSKILRTSIKELLRKRDASICKMMMFDVNADCNVIGIFEVWNSLSPLTAELVALDRDLNVESFDGENNNSRE